MLGNDVAVIAPSTGSAVRVAVNPLLLDDDVEGGGGLVLLEGVIRDEPDVNVDMLW